MLQTLRINNYALIDELYVEFNKSLNIITGETGAGKSILLGALGLILGKRADTSVLSKDDKKCVVEAEFDISSYNLESLFEKNDVDYDNHTVFRREILASGKSRAFVNDTPVTLGVMQELALHLVDIHSQHQNLLLNAQEFLLEIVDRYCGHVNSVQAYNQIFLSYKAEKDAYLKAKGEFDALQNEIDYLTHRVNELTEANISVGEIEEIETELAQLDNAEEIKTALHEASNALSSEDGGVLDTLQTIISRLQRVGKYFPQANNFSERLDSARIELKELDVDFVDNFEKLDFNPEHQQKIRERLDLLNGLLLRYRAADEKELLNILADLSAKLNVGVDGEFELKKQKEALKTHGKEVLAKAAELSEKRQAAFSTIESKVAETLVDLGIEHGVLKIERIEQEPAINGVDQLRFLFTANKNHPLNDVSKIASGGEMSRLMLSVKALLSASVGMPTIILDEIDTGVSGEIADKVGNIIRNMSAGMQVINITHLPQVASKAEAHFKVYKNHDKHYTTTQIKQLSNDERLEEIAKMLSGEELTEAALENARILINK